MKTNLVDVAYALPSQIVENEKLHAEYPHWNMAQVEARAGVFARRIAGPEETAFDLSLTACRQLLEAHPELKNQVDAILYCTQSPDYLMPPNACLLHKALDLKDQVFALDFTLACSGYVYGLAMAEGLLQAGFAHNILLVTADTYSRFIHAQDRSARTLFGDGAAVSWLSAEKHAGGGQLIDVICETSGKGYDKFMIPAGGSRQPSSEATQREIVDAHQNVRTLEHIHMDGMGILVFVNSKVPPQIRQILARHQWSLEEVDLFVFHQGSKMALDALQRGLNLPAEKVFSNLAEIGNTVSASIPIALKEAQTQGKIKPGSKVLLSGFGVGLSWATALLQY